ncbi:MAG: G8 domain-containing protein [Burkholderiaceae bacterium]|nr:G8 domain-containing protein [Burkholderiaceae bacterium]
MRRTLRAALAAAAIALLAACSGSELVNDEGTPAPPPLIADGPRLAWSDPATWGGALPGEATDVVIPAGRIVVLDRDATVRSLAVDGVLLFAERDLTLRIDWLHLRPGGRLQAGTLAQPRRSRLDIVLTARDADEDVAGLGTNVLAATDAIVELHGERRLRWTRLDGTAAAGAREIRVLSAAGWRAGDRIAIAPTDFEPAERETRAIVAIDGNRVMLDAPLAFQHWGRVQTLGDSGATLDQRAPVALLTSNITLRADGPVSAADARFGGQLRVRGASIAQFSHIAIEGFGQRGRLARYPLYWDRVADGSRSYLASSAIVDSRQRGIVVHRSDGLLHLGNAVVGTLGHAVMLESSVERRNVFERNLVLGTEPIPRADRNAALDFEFMPVGGVDASNGGVARVAGFWISNAHNRFTNNHVAGVLHGNGYWFMEGAHSRFRNADFCIAGPRTLNDNGGCHLGYNAAFESLRAASTFLEFRNNTVHTVRNDGNWGETHFTANLNGIGVLVDRVSFHGATPPVIEGVRAWKIGTAAVWGPMGYGGGTPGVDRDAPVARRAAVIQGLVAADLRVAVQNREHNTEIALRGGVLWGMTDNQPPGRTAADYGEAFWKALGNHNDDLRVMPLQVFPFNAGDVTEVTEAMVLGTPRSRLSELSNVVQARRP